MAKVMCVRCFTATPAVTRERFSYAGYDYELALCDSHADLLQRDLHNWIRIATEVRTFTPIIPSGATPMRGPALQAALRKEQAALQAERESRQEAAAQSQELGIVKPWSLSEHATLRAAERGYTKAEVLLAAGLPEQTVPVSRGARKGEGLRLHVRGAVVALCNPEEYVVITVMHRDDERYQAELKERATHGTT